MRVSASKTAKEIEAPHIFSLEEGLASRHDREYMKTSWTYPLMFSFYSHAIFSLSSNDLAFDDSQTVVVRSLLFRHSDGFTGLTFYKFRGVVEQSAI